MAVNLSEPSILHPVAGVCLGVAEAAIKKPGRNDLVVITLTANATVAGVFTRNAFAAAPVTVCRNHLQTGQIRALVINSGNANAATGNAGQSDALAICEAVADHVGCAGAEVLPLSTGVIGQRLPVDRMRAAVPRAVSKLNSEGWSEAMRAIMTTDTVGKGATRRVRLSSGMVSVTGIAKGVGMIHPDMATMLAFVATDARLSAAATRGLLAELVDRTFNCVTVDGDTSTNDTCILAATGAAGGPVIDGDHPDYPLIRGALMEVFRELAHAVVRDGEGATKFVEIEVSGATNEHEARQVGLAIAHSPLVKTALFASDANWGRIVMAIGKSGVPNLDPGKIDVSLDAVPLLRGGEPHPDYREEKGAAVVKKPEFRIGVGLGRGSAAATVWTCDLSYEYVKINAEYRT
jgi:glutamate N-acetyltransferase / amino-acid N-acetyltransferase